MPRKNKTLRADSWAAPLTEAQAWELYGKARQTPDWVALGKFAVKEYGIKSAPCRGSFYKWKKYMDGLYSQHRLEESALAAIEARDLAKTVTDKQELVDAFAASALNAALKTDDKGLAKTFTELSLKFADIKAKEQYFEFQKAYQAAREKRDQLAREKFEASERRLAAASSTVADEKLTDEEKIRELDKLFGRHVDP